MACMIDPFFAVCCKLIFIVVHEMYAVFVPFYLSLVFVYIKWFLHFNLFERHSLAILYICLRISYCIEIKLATESMLSFLCYQFF